MSKNWNIQGSSSIILYVCQIFEFGSILGAKSKVFELTIFNILDFAVSSLKLDVIILFGWVFHGKIPSFKIAISGQVSGIV